MLLYTTQRVSESTQEWLKNKVIVSWFQNEGFHY